jgi:hypothetical protein
MMSDHSFDELARLSAKSVTRRQTLRGLAAVLGAAVLGTLGARTASAAPQECVTCTCGVGRPCNPKSTVCTELRGFPVAQSCTNACAAHGQSFCGQATEFHCPRGCTA